METAPIDLDAQQLLEPDVGKMNVAAKMIEESKLAGFVGRLERRRTKSKAFDETLRECNVEFSLTVEHAHFPGRLPGLHDDLDRSGVEPSLAPVDQLIHHKRLK